MAFTIKQDDTRPVYVVPLVSDFGGANDPIDLTDATAVKFLMRLQGDTGPPKVNAPAVITDAAAGEVTYTWDAADTDVAGTYEVEFQITWSDGGVQTIPNDSYFTVEIKTDLGD
jgi:hypothetical protein